MDITKSEETLQLILDEIRSAVERRDHTWQDRRQTASVILSLAEAYAWIHSPDQGHGSSKTVGVSGPVGASRLGREQGS
jgi:hypothetical protein